MFTGGEMTKVVEEEVAFILQEVKEMTLVKGKKKERKEPG